LHQTPRDTVVLNFDNPLSTRLRPKAIARVVWFSRTRALNDGARIERSRIDGRDWLTWIEAGNRWPVLPVGQVLPGQHNLENALAALAIAAAWGAPPEAIGSALAEFKGVPHRLELVRELDGVQYINDTTATAPQATVAALETIASRGGRVFLLAGGFDKGLDYDAFADAIRDAGALVILLPGSATDKMIKSLERAGVGDRIAANADTLEQAVSTGHRMARAGDTVLLSPGAASFGMFVNEFDRGDQFRQIVERMTKAATQ
jgi:UDP-N-acetylmuramoylalanine--D-glutamate ligase